MDEYRDAGSNFRPSSAQTGTHRRNMMYASFIVALASVLVATMALISPVAAKKPKKLLNGCTAEQIQSSAAKDCIDKMEADVAAGRPYVHAVFCGIDGPGMSCCQTGGGRTFGCKSIGLTRPASADFSIPTGGGVLEPGRKPPRRDTIAPTGGILEPDSRVPTQGPSGMGTPGRAPVPAGPVLR